MDSELEQNSAPPQVGGLKGLLLAIKGCFVDWSFKPLRQWLVDELKGMEKGWVLCFTLLGLAAFLTYCTVNYFNQKKLVEKDGEITAISKDRDTARNELLNVKMDSREISRQKDEEITTLNNKVNSLEQRVTLFETLPTGILSIATNIASLQSNGLASPQELRRVLTNALSSLIEQRPAFQISYNGTSLTNHSIIRLDTNRQMNLSVRNNGLGTASKIVVRANVGLDSSNIIASGWGPQPSLPQGVPNAFTSSSFITTSDVSFPPSPMGFLCAPLTITTNAPSKVTWVNVSAHSESTAEYGLTLLLDLRHANYTAQAEDIATETFSTDDSKRVVSARWGTNNTYIMMFMLAAKPNPESIMVWKMENETGFEIPGL